MRLSSTTSLALLSLALTGPQHVIGAAVTSPASEAVATGTLPRDEIMTDYRDNDFTWPITWRSTGTVALEDLPEETIYFAAPVPVVETIGSHPKIRPLTHPHDETYSAQLITLLGGEPTTTMTVKVIQSGRHTSTPTHDHTRTVTHTVHHVSPTHATPHIHTLPLVHPTPHWHTHTVTRSATHSTHSSTHNPALHTFTPIINAGVSNAINVVVTYSLPGTALTRATASTSSCLSVNNFAASTVKAWNPRPKLSAVQSGES